MIFYKNWDTTDWYIYAFFAVVVIMIIYDTFAVLYWGRDMTISHHVYLASKKTPVIPWLYFIVLNGLGVHFFVD